jgi:MoaA/NifB/PqqE/SkfB family radical SAM enzyme
MKAKITDKIDAVTKIGSMRIKMGGCQPPPKSVKIELTSKCNLRCKFCAVGTREKQANQDMDFWLFQKITEDMRISGVEEIGLFYLGESFMNKELLIKAIKWCKELDFPYLFLTSNATLADSQTAMKIMNAGLDSLKWSINFSTPEQFEEITGRSGDLMVKALDNIKLAYKFREMNGYTTALYASSILYEGEQKERMQKLVDTSITPYVDQHYWLPLYQMSMYREKMEKDLGFTPTAGNCGRIDENTLLPTRLPIPCWCAITEGHVRYDGGLSACGFGADDKFDMGLLDGTNFMRQWNSPKFVALREAQFKTIIQGQDALKGTPCEVCVAYEGEKTSIASAPEVEHKSTTIGEGGKYD